MTANQTYSRFSTRKTSSRTEKMSIQDIRKNKTSAVQVIFKALTKNILTLALGGVIMGTGVCVMHFLGMQAVVLDADIHWNAGITTLLELIPPSHP